MSKYDWKKSYQYKRIIEVLEAYWLSEPDEAFVCVQFDFIKANGEYQRKYIRWFNPNMELSKILKLFPWKEKNNSPFAVSISLGYVEYPHKSIGYSITPLLAEADSNLYFEKRIRAN